MSEIVHAQDLSGDERGLLQINDSVGDVLGFSDSAGRLQRSEGLNRFGLVHACPDHAGCDGIYPNALLGVLDREGASDCLKSALGQHRECRREHRQWLLSNGGGDVDDVPSLRLEHASGREPFQ